jgi:antitoxin CcdA
MKRAANVSIDADLLEKAKALDINLSQALEGRLTEIIAERMRKQWIEENADAIDAYNERIEREGVFGDDLRTF